MCPLGRCTLSPCHHTIPSCDKQWPCHLLTVGFLAFCFPQLLGRTGRALEGRAGAPLPFLAGFWAGWGLIPKPGDSASPLHDLSQQCPSALGTLGSWCQGFLSFPQRNESTKGSSASIPVAEHTLSLFVPSSVTCVCCNPQTHSTIPKILPGDLHQHLPGGHWGSCPTWIVILSQKRTSSAPSPAPSDSLGVALAEL